MKEYISKFKEDGFAIIDLNYETIEKIRNELVNILKERNPLHQDSTDSHFLNCFHLREIKNLNDLRLSTIQDFNLLKSITDRLYEATNGAIDKIVGTDLAVQKNINLSFQLPNDTSSLLPIHSDVWSGNSPFEAVLWIPFVDVSKSKSMYILPRKYSLKYHDEEVLKQVDLGKIYEIEKENFIWPNVKFGQAIIFSHALLHGNITNEEDTTRFSLNLRFKTLTSPYGSKSLGDYFIPFRMTPISELAWGLYGK